MLPLRTRALRAGTTLHRIHRLIHDPIFFGPPGSEPLRRYDAPGDAFKVLYLAKKLETAFGETLVRVPTVTDVLSTDVLLRGRSEIVTTRRLDLYPLNDAGLSAHGLKVPDIMGDNYVQTWNLSAYVHANTKADGILYASRFNNGECIALFDRAADAVITTHLLGEALTPELATQLAMAFGKGYADP